MSTSIREEKTLDMACVCWCEDASSQTQCIMVQMHQLLCRKIRQMRYLIGIGLNFSSFYQVSDEYICLCLINSVIGCTVISVDDRGNAIITHY